jgi:hypothetical protein
MKTRESVSKKSLEVFWAQIRQKMAKWARSPLPLVLSYEKQEKKKEILWNLQARKLRKW